MDILHILLPIATALAGAFAIFGDTYHKDAQFPENKNKLYHLWLRLTFLGRCVGGLTILIIILNCVVASHQKEEEVELRGKITKLEAAADEAANEANATRLRDSETFAEIRKAANELTSQNALAIMILSNVQISTLATSNSFLASMTASSNAEAASASALATLNNMNATTIAANWAATNALRASASAESTLTNVLVNVKGTFTLLSRFQRLGCDVSFLVDLEAAELKTLAHELRVQFEIAKTNVKTLRPGYWYAGTNESGLPVVALNRKTSPFLQPATNYLSPLLSPTFKLSICVASNGTDVVLVAKEDTPPTSGPVLTYVPASGTQKDALKVSWGISFPRDAWEASSDFSTYDRLIGTWLQFGIYGKKHHLVWKHLSSPEIDVLFDQRSLEATSLRPVVHTDAQSRENRIQEREKVPPKKKGAKATYRMVEKTISFSEPNPDISEHLCVYYLGFLSVPSTGERDLAASP